MKTYQNDVSEVYATDSYDRVQLGIHAKSVPDTRAAYAMDLMKLMAVPMSMDGHPQAVVKTPREIAEAACNVAEAAFNEFAKRGWMIEVPSIADLKDDARENRGKN